MSIRYVDVHSHLQFEQFAHDEEKIINQMQEQGIASIVVGVDFESSKKAVALAEKHEHLYAAVGLHPNHADEPFDEAAYRALAAHSKVVAIGECGIDFFRPVELNNEVKSAQKELLKQHIALAVATNKPLIIHCRPTKGTQDAYHDLIEIVKEAKKEHSKLRGDIHFFVGGIKEAEAFFALDFTISFTAVITFARDYDAVVRAVPLAHILSETDAPYVAPASRRGQRNDPLSVIDVITKIAEIRGEDPEIVRETLLANAQRLFFA
ncbi:MAG: TatD family hydrolase [Candidatus Parcubacteria bacterium]|nr:TatD family hydrolase [Candidatus Parcubacteria bacterium]